MTPSSRCLPALHMPLLDYFHFSRPLCQWPSFTSSSMSFLAVVDDHDPLLRYSGVWTDGGVRKEFKGTTRCSTEEGSNVEFEFEGTVVAVYGSAIAHSAPYKLSFTVDGTSEQSYSPPQSAEVDTHHQPLYSIPKLSAGHHKLVITVASATLGHDCGAHLDYITFMTNSTNVPAYSFDDRDLELVHEAAWQQMGLDQDFMNTSQKPQTSGESKMRFEFIGAYFRCPSPALHLDD
ncbi:hypothetical protein MKEN_00389100 [Mycena kentingensis (nom. inval.)]|nr:hypothetical protein MKEN_00389100 [Mycena kentingensis (nom. inval.)]